MLRTKNKRLVGAAMATGMGLGAISVLAGPAGAAREEADPVVSVVDEVINGHDTSGANKVAADLQGGIAHEWATRRTNN